MLRKFFLLIIFCTYAFTADGQTPLWGFALGGNTADMSRVCKVAPNGNVCVAGRFSGSMYLDPGPGVHMITSNGADDIFLAVYSPAGTYLWGFGIGGANYDGAWNMAIDQSSNIIICGYIQSSGIDFDPSTGTDTVGYAGGSGIPFYGDGFIAKYSSTGVLDWAKNLGGSTVYDVTLSVSCDAAGNVYAGGTFMDTMRVSAGRTLNSITGGGAYIIKYDGSGNFIWAHNYGQAGSGLNYCFPNAIQVAYGNIYAGGFFQGTADFNAWAGGARLTAAGTYDGFLAKYDTSGNFVFARQISGSGTNDALVSLALDSFNNVYCTGFTSSSSLIFDSSSPGTSSVYAPGGGGNFDLWLASYDTAGRYRWGKVMGGNGDDIGFSVGTHGDYIYASGSFQRTVDFDPDTSVASFSSSGGSDIYLVKYDLSGHYLCGLKAGSVGNDDIGYSLATTDSGSVYLAGQFSDTGVAFDPSRVISLTSTGASDGFLTKYKWQNDSLLSGYLSGDTVCSGFPGHLTLHITSGATGTYTVTLYNGVSFITVAGVISGVPFSISPMPLTTTRYNVVAVIPSGADLCALPSGSIFGSATITVGSPNAHISDSVVSCSARFFASIGPATLHLWDFGDGTTSTLNNVTHVYGDTGTIRVTLMVTDIYGCRATDTTFVRVNAPVSVNLGSDTTICSGSPLRLRSLTSYPRTASYLWSDGSSDSVLSITYSQSYWLKVTNGICSGSDTISVHVKTLPVVDLGNDTAVCGTIVLTNIQPSGSTYLWSTGATTNSISIASSGRQWLQVTDSGCSATDTIKLIVSQIPQVHLGADLSVCEGTLVPLRSSDSNSITSFLWNNGSTDPEIFATDSGMYWLRVVANGCTNADSINVSIQTNPTFSLGNDTAICKGESLTLSVTEPPGAQYAWTDGSTGNTLTVQKEGIYGLIVSHGNCSRSDSIQVFVNNSPTINLGRDTSICNGYVMHLFINGDAAQYLWSTGSNSDNISITESGTYWATITNNCGVATDTVDVSYHYCDIWVPAAFTPNGDGKNEQIRPLGNLAAYQNYKFAVYNRWGALMLMTEEIDKGWDGTYLGQPQGIGTYFYIITYILNGRKQVVSGDFELLR